ncbi:DUF6653 family protein [Stappia sp. ICDLI1TA098]|jgi:hypothetical protein
MTLHQEDNGSAPRPARYAAYRPIKPGSAGLLGMDSETWHRHASGWSVWTRFATLPFLYLALWSHAWLGWPAALGLLALVAVWLWINPRLFPPPRRFDTWHARATFGERVWLNRLVVPIPAGDNRRAMALSLVTGVGFFLGVWGALSTNLPALVAGTVLTYAGKMAFLAVMAKLYDRMRDAHPVYRSWSVVPDNDNRTRDAKRRRTGS